MRLVRTAFFVLRAAEVPQAAALGADARHRLRAEMSGPRGDARRTLTPRNRIAAAIAPPGVRRAAAALPGDRNSRTLRDPDQDGQRRPPAVRNRTGLGCVPSGYVGADRPTEAPGGAEARPRMA